MLPITSFVFTVFHMMFYLKVYDSIRQQNFLSNWKYILNALKKEILGKITEQHQVNCFR